MFNVTKALKKLKEIREEYIPENYMIDRKALEEILLAGQSDEAEYRLTIHGHQQILDRFKALEERLARLEAVFLKEWKHNHLKEPSKPVTEEKPIDSRGDLNNEPNVLDNEMNEWMNAPLGKPDNPSEFISIPRDVAERYIRYVEAKEAPEAIEYYRSRKDVIDAIKQQLG